MGVRQGLSPDSLKLLREKRLRKQAFFLRYRFASRAIGRKGTMPMDRTAIDPAGHVSVSGGYFPPPPVSADTISIGNGNTIVELLSPAICVSVCR